MLTSALEVLIKRLKKNCALFKRLKDNIFFKEYVCLIY